MGDGEVTAMPSSTNCDNRLRAVTSAEPVLEPGRGIRAWAFAHELGLASEQRLRRRRLLTAQADPDRHHHRGGATTDHCNRVLSRCAQQRDDLALEARYNNDAQRLPRNSGRSMVHTLAPPWCFGRTPGWAAQIRRAPTTVIRQVLVRWRTPRTSAPRSRSSADRRQQLLCHLHRSLAQR